ncbi:hypothetical protein GCM10023231_39840 [Olivibacter ginsenosidimutans]|uniref:Uncharacterized protein n=2 Tax=Olivibacter ginsenosidimutans TaxID=1176537 RepID=A0ABP9CBD7_9SPHI
MKIGVPNLFTTELVVSVDNIIQKYSAEGEEKRISLVLPSKETYTHSYVNKDYLPSPKIKALNECKQLLIYIPKSGKGHTFYGIETLDHQVLQSRRLDLAYAYFNNRFIVFFMIVLPIALYWVAKDIAIRGFYLFLFMLHSFLLAYIWGKVHWFLMIVLIVTLIRLNKKRADRRAQIIEAPNAG